MSARLRRTLSSTPRLLRRTAVSASIRRMCAFFALLSRLVTLALFGLAGCRGCGLDVTSGALSGSGARDIARTWLSRSWAGLAASGISIPLRDGQGSAEYRSTNEGRNSCHV
jgi:hypothetical protein